MKKTYLSILGIILILATSLSACKLTSTSLKPYEIDDNYGTYYEVLVYSFADSDDDGIGDFKGLRDKLDYINAGDSKNKDSMGFDGIWLMPIMPSPTYHKYDVTDYKAIDPEYGTMEDFEQFIEEAHKRGIKVIIDLVMNHSSNQHPWFLEAVEALEKGDMENPYIDYYHFSQEKPNDTWHDTGVPGWYYEGVFWSGMPDFNLESEALRAEFKAIMEFWLKEKNIDGFRLDAVKEFYTGQSEKNIETLRWINDMAKDIKEDAYLVGEAWSSFGEYKMYYTSGIDSFFDFAFADQSGLTVSKINLEDGAAYAANLAKAQGIIQSQHENAINASFVSNHDTGRLAGFLASDVNKLKLAAATNLFTTGSSFVYYGEEIAMKGAGRDENKRAPMFWADEDKYQTQGPKDMEENGYSYPLGSVAEQLEDKDSLLRFYQSLIQIRRAYPEIARGETTHIETIEEKSIMPIHKKWQAEDGTVHESVIIINFSSEEKILNLPDQYKDYKLVQKLNINQTAEVTYTKAKLSLPGYAVVVLKPN